MKYQAVKGMNDILPRETPSYRKLECAAHKIFKAYGFGEIRTPLLEDTSIFVRGIGETSDIVTKEMYTFADRKGRSLTMRPEGTASVVRSFIEHGMDKDAPVQLYYIGPMFRSERPQKGRTRQFHQIGAEIIGTGSKFADARILIQLDSMLKSFGLEGYTIKINTLGCPEDKKAFAADLGAYLGEKTEGLCPDCRIRMNKNVLRTLDCKVESCRAILNGAPDIKKSLCPSCADHFSSVKMALDACGIKYSEEKNLVRGLDYYTRTVFEITHTGLGAQDAIGAGGRYDNLVKDLGGPNMGAIGYAIGVERVLLALASQNTGPSTDTASGKPVVFIASLGDQAKIIAEKTAQEIFFKIKDVVVYTDIKDSSLKSQLRQADGVGAGTVIIIGDDEIKRGVALFKDMAAKSQREISLGDIVNEIAAIK